jgi:hypothetical protein
MCVVSLYTLLSNETFHGFLQGEEEDFNQWNGRGGFIGDEKAIITQYSGTCVDSSYSLI